MRTRVVRNRLSLIAVVVLAAALLVSGCAGFGGTDDDPAEEPPATATPTATPEPTPDPTPTVTPTPEPEPKQTSLQVDVVEFTSRDLIETGTITLYNNSGALVDTHDLDSEPLATFDELAPGETYRIEAQNLSLPPVNKTVTPGDNESIRLTTGYDHTPTDSIRYQGTLLEDKYYRSNNDTTAILSRGKWAANGDKILAYWTAEEQSLPYNNTVDTFIHHRYTLGYRVIENPFEYPRILWIELDGVNYVELTPPPQSEWGTTTTNLSADAVLSAIDGEGITAARPRAREYLGTAEINRTAIPDGHDTMQTDVYDVVIPRLTRYEMRLYVNQETGNVVRGKLIQDVYQTEDGATEYARITDYWDHGGDITVSPGRYGLDPDEAE